MELLVVVAILTLLVGIALAVMAPIREKVRRSQCISNLRQIHLALMMYCSDYSGSGPIGRVRYSTVGLPPVGSEADWLDRYLKTRKVWKCPNDSKPPLEYPRSYRFYWTNDLIQPGQLPFPDKSALCGDRLPIFDCPNHGFEQGTDYYLIILRWNGQVKGQYVQVPPTPCLD
jgi:type II secretory pathway pseudopilin PulG